MAVDSTSSRAENSLINKSENRESLVLLWFDSDNELQKDMEYVQRQLRSISDRVIFHTDFVQCITSIQSTNDTEKILLITSGSKSFQLLPRVSSFHQLDSIFIYCTEKDKYRPLIDEHPKMIDIYTDYDTLFASIREQTKFISRQLSEFSVFEHDRVRVRHLSQQSAKFLWFQLFNQAFLHLPLQQQTKERLIDTLRYYYCDNPQELQSIDQFEREYRSEDALHWYLKDSFVYRLIQKALTTKAIDQLLTFHPFLNNLREILANEHQKSLSSEEGIITLYRGDRLDKQQFIMLKDNQGKILSMGGYFFASPHRSSATSFALKQSRRTDIVPVLFEIECHVAQLGKSVTFANTVQFSEDLDAQGVLFDLDAAFRIQSIEKNEEVYLIRMITTSDAENLVKDYIDLMQYEEEKVSINVVFGRLLCELGEYDQSQEYFEQLLTVSNEEDMASIEFNIGRTFAFREKWKEAREYYDRSYDRMMSHDPAYIRESASVLNSIGLILRQEGKYDEALDYFQRTLKIQEEYYPSRHFTIVESLNNIGAALKAQQKDAEALSYYQRALITQQNDDDSSNGGIYVSLNNIGAILSDQEKYDQALDHFQRALQIQEKYYPSGHADMSISLNNIGIILRREGKIDQALEVFQRAFKIQKKYDPSNHEGITHTLNNIGYLLYNQDKYNESLEHYQQTLKAQKNADLFDPIAIAETFTNIGTILYHKKKYDEALYYSQEALKTRRKFCPTDHLSTYQSFNMLAYILYHQEKYEEALYYSQQAMKIRQTCFPSNDIIIGRSLYFNGLCYEMMDKLELALYYYRQALMIYERFLPEGHQNRLLTECRISRVIHMK